ncbi:MAG: hypothetical protein NVV82_19435 [Sporocytophaga sp.]|nr:hypothetical protein [Sporocytophaga sp.]
MHHEEFNNMPIFNQTMQIWLKGNIVDKRNLHNQIIVLYAFRKKFYEISYRKEDHVILKVEEIEIDKVLSIYQF